MGCWFEPAKLKTEQLQVAARERTKSPPISPAEAEPTAEFFTQRKRPESGRGRRRPLLWTFLQPREMRQENHTADEWNQGI
jgi:hypothetical protein